MIRDRSIVATTAIFLFFNKALKLTQIILITNAPILTFREVTDSKVHIIVSSLKHSRTKGVYWMNKALIESIGSNILETI